MLSGNLKVGDRDAKWMLFGFGILVFFFMLGGRSLNEPDEGRYAEVAREMIETGDWLVPHIWYVPHLDKPPLTYWMVALSMSVFGQGEWAVRLPLALAALSGLGAVWCLGTLIGGTRVGLWSGLILASSMLYCLMARMLTTDMILTQFIAWAVYFLWRAWQASSGPDDKGGFQFRTSLVWHLAGWAMLGLGFLVKGPIAAALPLFAITVLMVIRREQCQSWRGVFGGTALGLLLFSLLVLPWFMGLFQAVPHAWDYMVKGQFLGHALGTTIKNRKGFPLYYAAIIAVGWLPWTLLLGWLWRKDHWRSMNKMQKDGWILLSTLSLGALILFSAMRAKLPAYILPVFPCLAVLTAARFFGGAGGPGAAPQWVWRGVLLSPAVLAMASALTIHFVFRAPGFPWLYPQALAALVVGLFAASRSASWAPMKCARYAILLSTIQFFVLACGIHTVETLLKSNQTFKPLGEAIRANWGDGAKLVCWGRFPQGLPFYCYPVISASQKPFLGGLPLDRVPFEFPGNKEDMSDRLLPDAESLLRFLSREDRVLVVGYRGVFDWLRASAAGKTPRLLLKSGDWELIGVGAR